MRRYPADLPTLDQIQQLADPAARGRALERYVADLFRQRHFDVRVDAGVARPRQSDIFAIKVSEQYLIECKWQQRPADIGDIDSLRARLDRTRLDVVGLLVSMSGFTENVRADVEQRRHQPVLLISGTELQQLDANHLSLPALLARKTDALLRDGTALLDAPESRQRREPQLPHPFPDREFVLPSGQRGHVTAFAGSFDPVVFTQSLADIDWRYPGGAGVSLDAWIDVFDELDLINALTSLTELGWTTEKGRWMIRQASRSWHGLGVRSIIEELPDWQPRAEHHTEQIVYVDRCDNGFYTLSAELSADRSRRCAYPQISFQLEGDPLDKGPLLQLFRVLGMHDSLVSRPRLRDSRNVEFLRDAGIPNLRVSGYLITEDPLDVVAHRWVTGLVVDNPFHSRASGTAVAAPPNELTVLRGFGSLICDLRHQHPVDQPPEEYFLQRIEWTWTSDTLVCHPVADWSDLPLSTTPDTPPR